MGFLSKGGVTVVFGLITLVLLVVSLLPNINWATVSKDATFLGNTTLVQTYSYTLSYSLWENCTNNFPQLQFQNDSLVPEFTFTSECTMLSTPNKDDFKSSSSMERNGAVAGIILGVLFTAAALAPLCCFRRAWLVVLLQLLGVGCTVAGVVSFYLYKTDVLDEALKAAALDTTFAFQYGLYLAGAAAGTGLLALFGACCVRRKDSDYESLNDDAGCECCSSGRYA